MRRDTGARARYHIYGRNVGESGYSAGTSRNWTARRPRVFHQSYAPASRCRVNIPAPGRIINGLHVWAAGGGRPVVVLEAGIAASSVSWSLVHTRVAEFTRVVSYDRAGFGWSASPPLHCSAASAACSLAALLAQSELPGPYVLVGHSFGGLIVRRFQQQFPRRVAGMVLVDPVIRAEWKHASGDRRRMLERGVMLSRRGAVLARIGVVGLAIRLLMGGSRQVPRLLARASAGRASGITDRLVGEVAKLPREYWPAIAQHWSKAQSFTTMAGYLENLPTSAAHLDERRALDDLPLVVLSAKKHVPEHAHDAALSTSGENIVLADSGHWTQLDAPDAVADAIRRVVAQVRAR